MRPNILFFTSHDLGQHLGCYGQDTVWSPALDSLAAGGVLFENSFCTAPQCSPSRAALHTGRYPHSVGMLGLAHNPFGWRLHQDEAHLASILRGEGYETVLYGVQHLTDTDKAADLGFEKFDRHDPVVPAPDIADKVAAYLDEYKGERPFYLEVGFFEPHRPYDWGGSVPDSSHGVNIPDYVVQNDIAREEVSALQGAIRRMDQAASAILQSLDDRGLTANTWVIFAADHGLAMPRAKCTLYDPGIKVALIMRWPQAGIAGGRKISEMVSYVDIVPTILAGLRLSASHNLHGRSVWPLLNDEAYQANQYIFAEKTFHTAYEPVRGIRSERFKLIVNFEVDTKINVPDDIREGLIYPVMIPELTGHRPYIELYDLESDPGEVANLAGMPEWEQIERELEQELLAWMQRTADPLLDGPVASPFYSKVISLLFESNE
jgi:N-sulfoglucosamine sulfohydrolase